VARSVARHLILAPFAITLIAVWPLYRALDWAASGESVCGTLREQLRELYG